MTISGYSNAIVDLMLGWLKGLANWVLRLFNLAGGTGGSPLLWLSQNWLKLLVFFLALGIILDRLVWLIRWRPYWVWFRKERVIVNDDKFFANADMDKASDWEGDLESNWDEHDYVVASTVVKRQDGRRSRLPAGNGGKGGQPARRRSEASKVKRHVERPSDSASSAKADRSRVQKREKTRDRSENIFPTELKKRDVSDLYEDEVFNVSNLPVFDEFGDGNQSPRRRTGKRRGQGR